MKLTTFEDFKQVRSYDFTQSGVFMGRLSSNFGDQLPFYDRLIYSDGAFDNHGYSKAPQVVGSLTQELVLFATDKDEMEEKRDALRSILGYGRGILTGTPLKTSLDDRFTYARVNSLKMNEDQTRQGKQTELLQPAKLIFEVALPFWFGVTVGTKSLTQDTIPGAAPVTYDGNAPTLVKVTISPDSGTTLDDPIVRRLVDGVVVDEIRITGQLTDTDTLVIDPRELTVELNGNNQFNSSVFDFDHPRWLALDSRPNTEFELAGTPSAAPYGVDIDYEWYTAYFGS